jgi:nucleotide-binding universal stress UspA family protein
MDTTLRRIALMTQWTEFDSGAESAAIELAGRLQVPLGVVVPLLSNPEYEVLAHERVAKEEAATAQATAAFMARAHAAGVALDVRIRRGDELWREVVDEARSGQIDLLITRRRGHRSFLGKLRVGQMVRQIAAHSPCPVMMVPRAARAPERRMLVVLESGSAAKLQMRHAMALATALGLPLDVLVVVASRDAQPQGEGLLQLAMEVTTLTNVPVTGSVGTGPLAEVLASRMGAIPADLLVMGVEPVAASHGKLGDVVETVVGGVPCATLLVGLQTPTPR